MRRPRQSTTTPSAIAGRAIVFGKADSGKSQESALRFVGGAKAETALKVPADLFGDEAVRSLIDELIVPALVRRFFDTRGANGIGTEIPEGIHQ